MIWYVLHHSVTIYIVAIDYYNEGEYMRVKFTLWDVGEFYVRCWWVINSQTHKLTKKLHVSVAERPHVPYTPSYKRMLL